MVRAEEEESGRRGVVLFKECWRVVNSAEVGGGMVVVLWHDVGRLCRLVYLPFVCSRPCSCCRSERRVNNSVCSCYSYYTHIYPYWAMWPYKKMMYVPCA